ncbi:hypothetical protein EG341_11540 [Chryseobacterium lactis]|nr:hypothetical protein [Chryseobacterium lactis]AZB04538.1 hypothetical protein EG341_11540 [Chryseobacterium lactis]
MRQKIAFVQLIFSLLFGVKTFSQELSVNSVSDKLTINEIDRLLYQTSGAVTIKLSNEEVIRLNQKIIQVAEKKGYSKGEALGYVNIGNHLWLMGQYENAIKALSNAEKKAKGLDDPFLFAKINQEYAQVYYRIKLFDIALQRNATAISYARQNGDKGFLNYVYASRAIYFESLDKKDSVLAYYYKANNADPTPLGYTNIAEYYINNGKNTDSAEVNFQKAFRLLETNKFKDNIYEKAATFDNYAGLLTLKKDYQNALLKYDAAEKLARQAEKPFILLNIYRSKANVYHKLNDTKAEQAYLLRYTVLKDSIDKETDRGVNRSVTNIIEQNEKEISNSNRKEWILIVSLTLAGVILSLFIFFHQKRKQRRKEIDIEKKIIEKDHIIHKKDLETNELKLKINESFEHVVHLAKTNSPEFIKRFEEVYPEHYHKLQNIEPKLLNTEIKFCAMLYLNFSTKDIAEYTYVTIKTVQHRKFRLRKKLSIPSEADINDWILNLP